MLEVLRSFTPQRTVPFSTYSIKMYCFGWLLHKSGRMCVGYEAEMATLSLACCSPGSEVTAFWKSAECCWANCFISMAKVVWVSVEKRQNSLGMTEIQQHYNSMLIRVLCRLPEDAQCVENSMSAVHCFLLVFQ